MTKTSIEWTDETWNPVTGCDKVSPGCDNCYAESIAHRFAGTPQYPNDFGVTLRPERLGLPLKWRKPRMVFVNSMSDLFHKEIPDAYIAQVFAVMATAGRHTFQVLTKRPARMRALLSSAEFQQDVRDVADAMGRNGWEESWPLPNVWLGVSAEDQKWADIRIPVLLDTPAAIRFISAEPLLGPIDLGRWMNAVDWPECWGDHEPSDECGRCIRPDWVIVGGESGRKARPMSPSWARQLRDQCVSASVAFHFKQWGEWVTEDQSPKDITLPGISRRHFGGEQPSVYKVGKKAAGRELDGRTWDQFPEVS